jgi:hypothetical protein
MPQNGSSPMRGRISQKRFLGKALLLILPGIIFFEAGYPFGLEAQQVKEEIRVPSKAEDNFLISQSSPSLLNRNPFSPPFINPNRKKSKNKKDTLPGSTNLAEEIKLTGIIKNKLGKSAIIEISGGSYLVPQGGTINIANQELKVLDITDKQLILKRGEHLFAIGFLSQTK